MIKLLERLQLGKREAILLAVLWAAWTVEVFIVQEFTLITTYDIPGYKNVIARITRVFLDLTGCGLLIMVFWRRALYGVLAVWGVLAAGLSVYASFYGMPLSFLVITGQAGEGASAVPHLGVLLRHWYIPVIIAFAVGDMEIVRRLSKYNPVARVRLAMIGSLFAANLLVAFTLNLFFPLRALSPCVPTSAIGTAYGYLWTWGGEEWYFGRGRILEQALAVANEGSDQLTPVEAPLELAEKMAVIQVEALDYEMVGFREKNELIMPCLTSLAESGMFYRVKPIEGAKSADEDFVMLTGAQPLVNIMTYRIPGYPFDNALPRIARKLGYETTFLHGYAGEFFGRRTAMIKMGFEHIWFKEEIPEGKLIPRKSMWGVKDADLLRLAAKQLRESNGKQMQFIITLTSHWPYDLLAPNEMEVFGNPSSILERYLNCTRYVDNALKEYMTSIPDGTCVIIYGDHHSQISYEEGGATGRNGNVPFIIYQKGYDLSKNQKTRDTGLASSGGLGLLDMARYLRAQFVRKRV